MVIMRGVPTEEGMKSEKVGNSWCVWGGGGEGQGGERGGQGGGVQNAKKKQQAAPCRRRFGPTRMLMVRGVPTEEGMKSQSTCRGGGGDCIALLVKPLRDPPRVEPSPRLGRGHRVLHSAPSIPLTAHHKKIIFTTGVTPT
jgi:hypothetical protein